MREMYDVLDGLYIVGDTIGRGGFAKVKKATHLITGERVAIKILDKAALGEDLPRVAREIDTLKTLNHHHICKLYQVLETEEKIFMVMEYCRGGELFDYIVQRDRLEENEARKFFRQIASAVAFIHNKGVAHRDLKPENILLDDMTNVKLIDFGLCAVPPGGMKMELETCCGSPAYAAPELVKGERYIGAQADVWSLGILLYALLNGFLPFDDQNLGILYKKIQAGVYEEPKWLSEGSKNILRCMLQVNPHYRLSVDDLLNHTWCQDGKQPTLPVPDDEAFQRMLDPDVLQLMSEHLKESVRTLHCKLSKWNYTKYDTATYLVLLNRRNRLGSLKFNNCPFNIERANQNHINVRIQKSLQADFDECCDAVDSDIIPKPIAPPRPYHSSMEGGLDDYCLLQLGSPKLEDEKENSGEFLCPRVPSSTKKPKLPTPPLAASALSPAKSCESGLNNENMKTPVRDKWRNLEGSTPLRTGSPSRRKMLGSLERGLDRVRNMLTPRTNKTKKLKTITYNGNKAAFNISATASTDPDCVIAELKACLINIGYECQQKGYKLITGTGKSSKQNVKFELEVVAIEHLDVIGIRRTRTHGDSWQYKKIIEQVLSLTGVCQLAKTTCPRPEPLQTMV